MLQSDWLLKCKDIVIMTRGAKTIFLDTYLICNNPKDITLTMVCVLLLETMSPLTFIFASYQCQFHSMISDKFVCFYKLGITEVTRNMFWSSSSVDHDGMITNSINLICVLHSSSTRARPNRFISFMTLDSKPEPNTPQVPKQSWTMTR